MASIAEIIAERDAAVAILDRKLMDAQGLANAGATGMDAIVDTLLAQRSDVAAAAYAGALGSAELQSALATITAATGDMNAVASKMVTATQFVSNIAAFGGTVAKVLGVLQPPSTKG
jgi:hypothetical protein